MRKELRTLRLKRETLRVLTDRALARVAGGSWAEDPSGLCVSDKTGDCWSNETQSYSTGTKYC